MTEPLQQNDGPALHKLAGSDTTASLDTAKRLLDAGTQQVNEREPVGQSTALHVAAASGNLAMCHLLIHYGADVTALDAQGRIPADVAAGSCQKFFTKMSKPEERRRLRRFLAYLFNRRFLEKVIRRKARLSLGSVDQARPSAGQMLSETVACGAGPADDLPPAVLEALGSLSVADKDDGWVHITIPASHSSSTRMLYPRLSLLDSNPGVPSAPPEGLIQDAPEALPPRSVSLLPPVPERSNDALPPPPPHEPSLKKHSGKSLSTSVLSSKHRPQPVPDPFIEPPAVSDEEAQLRAKIAKYNIETLRNRLKACNIDVGPINDLNRSLYERKLAAIEVSEEKENVAEKYSTSLERMLRCEESDSKADMGTAEEHQLRMEFAVSSPQSDVSFFCYLLIDPTMVPADVAECTFRLFVAAIFYVGKGKRSRPLQHLVDASKSRSAADVEASEKLKRIIGLWDAGQGVVSLHICYNIHSAEAYIREGSMIEAIGVKNLTNLKHGEFRDCAKSWNRQQITDFGALCLKKAYAVFQNERCRPIFEADLK